jgi:hypothetical protein
VWTKACAAQVSSARFVPRFSPHATARQDHLTLLVLRINADAAGILISKEFS